MRRPDLADLSVLSAAAFLAGVDVHRHRHGLTLVTGSLRRPVVAAGLVVLTLHVLDVLGPFDPFRAVARRIPCIPIGAPQ